MSVTIWHNPRCSKSRETLRLLEGRGLKPLVIEYLKTPPSRDELALAARLLGRPVREMMRVKEPAYRSAGLASADDAALLDALVANPALIERPLVFSGDRAALGRPPEAVLDIL